MATQTQMLAAQKAAAAQKPGLKSAYTQADHMRNTAMQDKQLRAMPKAEAQKVQMGMAQDAARKAAAQKTGMQSMGAAFEAQKAAAAKAAAAKAAAVKDGIPRAGVKPAIGGMPQTVDGIRGVKTAPTAVPKDKLPMGGGKIVGGPGKFAKGGAVGRASARADGIASKGKTKGRMI